MPSPADDVSFQCAESALVDSSAIQAENEELKDELSELRLRLTAAQDTSQDTKPPLQVSQRSEHIPQPPQQKKEFKVTTGDRSQPSHRCLNVQCSRMKGSRDYSNG